MFTLLWSKIKDNVDHILNEYEGDGLTWFEKMWSIIISNCAADYQEENEKTLVYVRLISLIDIYRNAKYLLLDNYDYYPLNIEIYNYLFKKNPSLEEKRIYRLANKYDSVGNNEERNFVETLNNLIDEQKNTLCRCIVAYYMLAAKNDFNNIFDSYQDYLISDILCELITGDEYDKFFYKLNFSEKEIDNMRKEDEYVKIAQVIEWIENDMRLSI